MNTIPCMGGWCAHKREKCAHYHIVSNRSPSERLCESDREDAFQPMTPYQKRSSVGESRTRELEIL